MQTFINLLVLGFVGLGLEVVFTATLNALKPTKRRRTTLFGYSSLWYFPLYAFGMPAGILLLEPYVMDSPWFIRGIIYALVIHIIEFITMWLLHVINGASPSEKEYKASGHSLAGFTRWDFFPAFFALGLLFEYLVAELI